MSTMTINKARSYYKTNPEVLSTFNSSYLIPLKVLKVIPNGLYKISAGTIARLPALKVPVMGKLWLEFFAFYVPLDLLDKKFEKLITEGHDNSYDEDIYGQGSHTPNPESNNASIIPDLLTPKLTLDGGTGFEVKSGDLFNRLGLPIANMKAHDKSVAYNKKLLSDLQEKYKDVDGGADKIKAEYDLKKVREVPAEIPNGKFCAYSTRGYHLIWNTSFRSKFLQSPKNTDYGLSESNPSSFELLRVNRSADWFSRGFVNSQLYPVDIPLGENARVEFDNDTFAPVNLVDDYQITKIPLTETMTNQASTRVFHKYIGDDENYYKMDISANSTTTIGAMGVPAMEYDTKYHPMADLSAVRGKVDFSKAINLNLNDLRYAIGLSHISQKALYGTDMDTILKMNFNLVLPKAKLTEPYLFGYKRVPIEINQITQTAPSGDDSSNIGDVYGQSTTINRMDDGSFVFRSYNYGYIYLMCCVRHESVYQYGIDPTLTENDKFDYFQPDLQGLSNLGIPKKYIYFSGNEEIDNSTFNFNEPYSELKYDHNVVNGEFATDSDTPLDFYHLADIYNDTPSYDDKWIKDTTKEVLDRSLTITSENSDQVHAYFKFTYERTIPMADYFVGYDYI